MRVRKLIARMHGMSYGALVSTHSNWSAYVTSLGSTAKVAAAADVNASTVARWKSGANPPSPESVILLARVVGHSPLDALVAAGYLTAGEVDAVNRSVPHTYALREFSDLELAREAVRRIEEGSSSSVLVDPLDETHPAMQSDVGPGRDHSDDASPAASDDRRKDDYDIVAKTNVVEVDPNDSDV